MKRYLVCMSIFGVLSSCGGGSNDDYPSTPPSPTPTPTPKVDTQPDNEALVSFWKSELENMNQLTETIEFAGDRPAAQEPSPTQDAANEAADGDNYSSTNVQVAGVDELDALKFDGDVLLSLNTTANYYYFESGDKLQVPKVRVLGEEVLEGNAQEDPSLHFEASENNDYSGLLSHGNFATLVGQERSNFWGYPEIDFISLDCFHCYMPRNSQITLDIWQYKDGQQPIAPEPAKISIEGDMVSARSVDNKVYMLSTYSPQIEGFAYYPLNQQEVDQNQQIIDALTPDDLTPKITINGETQALTGDQDCILPGDLASLYYLPSLYILTEIDMENPSEFNTFCIIDHVQETYFGRENIYLLSNNYNTEDYTANNIEIRKISITDEGMKSAGVGEVRGNLSHDGYQLGEVDGKFAIVNTVYDYDRTGNDASFFGGALFYHQLTILEETDNALEVIGQIPNDERPESIGKPGESIYAVRFMNQRAYVVTFEKVDPLYVIDLADTSDPKIAGELEIPGFSDYVHVVSDNLLFGIGKNAINDGRVTWFQGLNIRLFDVSDPSQPTTLVDLDYGSRGSESALLFDPHALAYTLNEATGIARLALPIQIHDNDVSDPAPNAYYQWQESSLLQLEIDTQQKTMEEVARYVYASPESTGNSAGWDWYWSWGERSVINNDSIYFSHNSEIKVLEWGGSEVLRSFTSNPQ